MYFKKLLYNSFKLYFVYYLTESDTNRMKITRIHKIQEMLKKEKNLSLNDLCDTFNVSKNTIRRDINYLESQGIIKKVYGGIILNEPLTDAPEPFLLRTSKHTLQKQHVARVAASFVKDNDVIFIDSGTTTMHMLPYLLQVQNLTIITASVNVINVAALHAESRKFNLIATGGVLYYPSMAFTGPSVLNYLDTYNISKIFLASTGISLENGATNASIAENEIKRKLMTKSGQKFLLIDASKLDVASLVSFTPLSALDYLIIDSLPPQKYVSYCQEHHIKLITPEHIQTKQ